MAKPYIKPWPNDKAKGDWYVKVKVGGRWHAVSLQLRAPDNKRDATARANDLQAEIKLGALTSRTLAWLGERAAATLNRLLAVERVTPSDGTLGNWQAARAAYMKAFEEKDKLPSMAGKLEGIDRTRRTRDWTTGHFVRWLEVQGIHFPPRRSMTKVICDYVDWRKVQISKITGKTISPVSIDGALVYICSFAKWMHRKGLCEAIDRDEIREHQPNLTGDGLVLPAWQEDLAIIKKLHEGRRDFGPPPGYYRGNWSMWLMFLMVRGLGCRPSEAMTLSWETVDLERGIVRFILPKEMAKNKNKRRPVSPWRDVPILLQWVHDGLVEAKAFYEAKKERRRGKPKCSAVVMTGNGNHWKEDSYLNRQRRRTFKRLGIPSTYRFKHAQKCFIEQMVHAGFPFHVVAAFTGHSPETQRQYYCPTNTYLALDGVRDYGDFGVLSERGRAILNLCYRGMEGSAQYQATVAKGAQDSVTGGHTLPRPDTPQITAE